MLTTDVLVQTWDLTKALGSAVLPSPDLCAEAYDAARRSIVGIEKSGMYEPSVSVPDDADPVTKLVALLGRDPEWRAP